MKHLGDYDASAVIYGKFATYQPSTGAVFALGGSAALSVYKDNSVTQTTTGVTLTVSFDSVTGLNHFAIDTSADGTFYSAGSFFDIVITTGTVDGVSVVGAVVASFTIRKDSSLKPATAGRTLVVDAAGLADANAVKIGPTGAGTAQTARDLGTSVLLSSGTGTGQLDFTAGVVKANLVQILATALTETAGQIAGAFKKFFNVAAPTLTCLGIDQTGDSFARLGAPAGASIAADLAEIEGETDGIAGVAAGVWDVVLSGHLTSGTTGAALNAAGSAGDPWATALPGAYGAGTAGKIVGDNLDAAVSSRSTYAGADTAGTGTLLARLTATRAGLLDHLDADISTRLATSGYTAPPTANANADAMLDRAAGVETGITPRQGFRLMLAALAGKLSGAATTTVTIRDTTDTKNRIVATVDADGNRSAVTLDAS